MRQLLLPGTFGLAHVQPTRDLDARLRKVLRLRDGAALVVADGEGGRSDATLQPDGLALGPWRSDERPPRPRLILAVAPIKGERFDWLVEKAVELGADAITPLHMRHAVVRLDAQRALSRQQRWQSLADAAFEQSGRSRRVMVAAPQTLSRWLQAETGHIVVADERGGVDIGIALTNLGVGVSAQVDGHDDLNLVVGPEGGLADDERAALADHGAVAVTLGRAVLRAETAALALLLRVIVAVGR